MLRALDLFCKAGGVSVGLGRAGFLVDGVDIDPKFAAHWRRGMERHCAEGMGEFLAADALEVALAGYDFIWASPPCQAYSSATRITGKPQAHPDLVAPIRERLESAGVPWVIENVPGAPLRRGFILCGAAFGLEARGYPLKRHRLFEPSWTVLAPPCHCDRRRKLGVYGHGGGARVHKLDGYTRYAANVPEMREGMGIDWMTRQELTQAIPPAYSEWIGREAISFLKAQVTVRERGKPKGPGGGHPRQDSGLPCQQSLPFCYW